MHCSAHSLLGVSLPRADLPRDVRQLQRRRLRAMATGAQRLGCVSFALRALACLRRARGWNALSILALVRSYTDVVAVFRSRFNKESRFLRSS